MSYMITSKYYCSVCGLPLRDFAVGRGLGYSNIRYLSMLRCGMG